MFAYNLATFGFVVLLVTYVIITNGVSVAFSVAVMYRTFDNGIAIEIAVRIVISVAVVVIAFVTIVVVNVVTAS